MPSSGLHEYYTHMMHRYAFRQTLLPIHKIHINKISKKNVVRIKWAKTMTLTDLVSSISLIPGSKTPVISQWLKRQGSSVGFHLYGHWSFMRVLPFDLIPSQRPIHKGLWYGFWGGRHSGACPSFIDSRKRQKTSVSQRTVLSMAEQAAWAPCFPQAPSPWPQWHETLGRRPQWGVNPHI